MKEIIKNKWIIIFAIMVVGVFYIGSETPKTFDEVNVSASEVENI